MHTLIKTQNISLFKQNILPKPINIDVQSPDRNNQQSLGGKAIQINSWCWQGGSVVKRAGGSRGSLDIGAKQLCPTLWSEEDLSDGGHISYR